MVKTDHVRTKVGPTVLATSISGSFLDSADGRSRRPVTVRPSLLLHLARTCDMTTAFPVLLDDLLPSLPMGDSSKGVHVVRVDCGHTQVLRPNVVPGPGEIQLSIAALCSSMPNV
jgi:hypothetical protein